MCNGFQVFLAPGRSVRGCIFVKHILAGTKLVAQNIFAQPSKLSVLYDARLTVFTADLGD